ncbi:carbohydrate binding domain-containing protein [Nocardioides sp. C4-1]|uniref:carbohydrate binding domain-containing protein n=1 Tax=Nocardioides sp. C4-1 TaxID=3151851 RepID=UPI003265712A
MSPHPGSRVDVTVGADRRPAGPRPEPRIEPISTSSRTTPALALTAGAALVAAALAVPLSSSPATAATPGVVNGDLEAGTSGWSVNPLSRATLSSSTTAHGGQRALRVRTTTPRHVIVRATTATGSLHSGASASAGAWVRPAAAGQTVRLQVRERVGDTVVQTLGSSVTPAAGQWTEIRTALTKRRTDSDLVVRVVWPKSARGVDLLVDDVSLRTAAPGTTTPTTPPTPPTTPAPPPPGGGVLTNGCAHDARGLPACGGYLGAATGSNTDPATLESQLGRRLGVRRTFWTGTQVDKAVSVAAGDVARGRLPWISFKLPHSWESMSAGAGDAWARDLATKLARIDGPVWVAFHHEPEGDGDIQAWRTMQERLAPIVRSTAPNVAYTVVLTGWNQFYGDSRYSLAQLWPRGVKIDIAGFDLYNEYGVTKNGKKDLRWPDFDAQYYARIQAWAAQQGVAWGVAETAYTDEAHAADPSWIQTSYRQLLARGGVAMAYFDTELNAYGSWPLATPAKRASLATPLRDSAALRVR